MASSHACTEHDFTHGFWGHAISYYEPPTMLGHQRGISRGDRIRLGLRVFVVNEIEYYSDPPDMFKAKVSEYNEV